MTIYAIYTRNDKGAVQRDHAVFDWEGNLGPYAHEESLVGWPESRVFWMYSTGFSYGLAPIGAVRPRQRRIPETA